jgi:hypothetical protein
MHLLQQAGAHIEHCPIPALDEVHRLGEQHGTITAAEAYRWHQAIVEDRMLRSLISVCWSVFSVAAP